MPADISRAWGLDPRDLVTQSGNYMLLYSNSNARVSSSFLAHTMGFRDKTVHMIYDRASPFTLYALAAYADHKVTARYDDKFGVPNRETGRRDCFKVFSNDAIRCTMGMTDYVAQAYKGLFRDEIVGILDAMFDSFSENIDVKYLSNFLAYGAEKAKFGSGNWLHALLNTRSKNHAKALLQIMDEQKSNPYFQKIIVDMREGRQFDNAVTNIVTLSNS